MKRGMGLGVVAVLVFGVGVLAAQSPLPLSPQEQLDRITLQLAYADREHQMCRQSLADIWARGNMLETQARQLQDDKQRLVDELKALKEQTSAPATN